ncbi:MAG: type II secretion system protein [Elusimicrobia bacterium]|nr:type II secretion system protein [Elusimicrobiota bacterium]
MKKRGCRGYTLTELMMVVAIVGVLAAIGPPLLIGTQNFFLGTQARAEVQRDARNALDAINRYLRQADSSSIVVDTPSGGGPYSRVRFRMADGRSMDFHQDGSSLIQVVNGTTTSTVSRNLVYIAFTYPRTDDPTILSVSITMGKNIQLGRRQVLELTIQKVRIMN